MPKERSPNRDKAYELWIQSDRKLELKQIAKMLGVSPEQIRKWKSKDKWDSKSNGNVTNQKTESNGNVTNQKGKSNGNVTKPKGAPKGNKNALDNNGGAPKENKNARKHGIYEKLRFKYMSEDERELYSDEDFDTKERLKQQVIDCDLEIIRLSKLLEDERNKVEGMSVSGIITRKTDNGRFTKKEIETSVVSTTEVILKIMDQINKFHRQRSKCLESLIKYDLEFKTKQNGIVDDWIASVCDVDE